MSVVAWDGTTLAADKQATCEELGVTVTKLRRLPTGEVLAWTGTQGTGLVMADWYERGADPDAYPECQRDDDQWARLIVASPSGLVRFWEQWPLPQVVEDPFAAWGSGRDFALGAMAMGADAAQAVEIASRFSLVCGKGVDAVRVRDWAVLLNGGA